MPKECATQIKQQGGDYVFSLKGNQGHLHDDVKTFFAASLSPAVVSYEGDHGRIETRSIRATADKSSTETRYFISSLDANDPQRLARVVRAHWSIENNLHWVLDVTFDEDSNRTRNGHRAANLAVIRHIALNLIKSKKTAKVGIKHND